MVDFFIRAYRSTSSPSIAEWRLPKAATLIDILTITFWGFANTALAQTVVYPYPGSTSAQVPITFNGVITVSGCANNGTFPTTFSSTENIFPPFWFNGFPSNGQPQGLNLNLPAFLLDAKFLTLVNGVSQGQGTLSGSGTFGVFPPQLDGDTGIQETYTITISGHIVTEQFVEEVQSILSQELGLIAINQDRTYTFNSVYDIQTGIQSYSIDFHFIEDDNGPNTCMHHSVGEEKGTGSASYYTNLPTQIDMQLLLSEAVVPPSREAHTICIQTGALYQKGCPSTLKTTIPAIINTVTLTAILTDSVGNPVSGRTVTFTVKDNDLATNGGHHHHSPPPYNGHLEETTCTTAVDGRCSVVYDAEDTAGIYDVTASLTSGQATTEQLTVMLPGLEALPAGGSYAVLRGGTDTHPDGTYGTPDLIFLVRTVANAYQFYSGKALSINDMSLKWGGIFDIDNDWLPGHALHQNGHSVDINRTGLNNFLLHSIAAAAGLVEVSEPTIHYELP